MPSPRRPGEAERGTQRGAGPRGESDSFRSAALSARARQLTPQARERGGWIEPQDESESARARSVARRDGRLDGGGPVRGGGAFAPPREPPRRTRTASSSEVTAASSGGGSPARRVPGRERGSTSKALKLKSERATPNKVFFYGKRKATYHYSIAGSVRRNLKIQAVNRRNWRVARTWTRRQVRPGHVHTIRWSGTGKHRRPASAGSTCSGFAPATGPTRTATGSTATIAPSGSSPPSSRFAVGTPTATVTAQPAPATAHQGQDIFCPLRQEARRRPRWADPVPRLPGERRRLLPGGRRQGHRSRLRLHAPSAPGSPKARPAWFARASGSARSARRATPPVATSTSRCGRGPAGTRAAARCAP